MLRRELFAEDSVSDSVTWSA